MTRAEVRLRYSVLAEREVNRVLAERYAEFDAALQRGELPTISLQLVTDE